VLYRRRVMSVKMHAASERELSSLLAAIRGEIPGFPARQWRQVIVYSTVIWFQ